MQAEEISAALKATSRLLDGIPDTETVYGVQIILETLAASVGNRPR